MKVLFTGTSSGSGKTTITAMFCRHLHLKGIRTTPFKASNLSLNSFVLNDGGEIGVGQALQAWASGILPRTSMSPVLLRPSGKGTIQLILNGRPSENRERSVLMKEILKSYDSLTAEFDAVISEGSGSPAEPNLYDRDLANMGLARERNIPVILVGDIERGGVFAGIYGTWSLIPQDDRKLLKGFIINKYRGDESILRSGIEKIEELTGMCCLGIMPYIDLRFPEEDSMSTNTERLGPDVKDTYMHNVDILTAKGRKHLDMKKIEDIARSSAGCDL